MGEIIEASQLPAEEKVYLKKDNLGWRVVESWKKDVNKPANIFNKETWNNINWFNFLLGGKRALVALVTVLVITGLLYLGINELISNYKLVAENPCNFCTDCFEQTRSVLSSMSPNYSLIKFPTIPIQ